MKQKLTYQQLIRTVQQYVKKKRLLHSSETVIAAVSGGVDSMVMLDLLVTLQETLKLNIVVAHVNYQLRGKASHDDEQFVKKTAKRYGLPFYNKRSETKKIAAKKKLSLQETAREIRYSFFESLKHTVNANVIVTAHHKDDNAETMLMNLLRGSGIDGLAGIPPRRDAIVRPLLCVNRNEILRYAKERKITFRNDSTNAEDDYTRNFLRNKIIPVLKKRINPSLNETLFHESELFRAAADFTNQETEKIFKEVVSFTEIDIKKISVHHQFIQQSVIRRLLKTLMVDATFSNINSVIELMEQQKGTIVEIQNDWIAERLSQSIIVRKNNTAAAFEYRLDRVGRISTAKFTLSVKKSVLPDNKKRLDSSIEYVDAEKVKFPITIRSWKSGDVFFPLGLNGRKKVSDFFGEQKLSGEEKMDVPLVISENNIIWVAGKRLDERYKLTDSTTSTYQLAMKLNGKKNNHR